MRVQKIREITKLIKKNEDIHNHIFEIIKNNNEDFTDSDGEVVFDIEALQEKTLKEIEKSLLYWVDNKRIIKEREQKQQEYQNIVDSSANKCMDDNDKKEDWTLHVSDPDEAKKVQSFLNSFKSKQD